MAAQTVSLKNAKITESGAYTYACGFFACVSFHIQFIQIAR